MRASLSARLAPWLALALACATGRPQRITLREPAVVEGHPGADLAAKNDEELFAIGTAARQAGDHARAAEAFARLAATFPDSRRRASALLGAGLAWRDLGSWDRALPPLAELADHGTGRESEEAGFLAAEALYHLGRGPDARARLDLLAGRADLGPAGRTRALTQRGVIEFEDGEPEVARRTLEAALSAAREASGGEPVPPYYPAKARFYLGEMDRASFEAVRLDPGAPEGQLSGSLARKADLLLAAQDHYLEAMRAGDPEWTVAAGTRVGELYDELYGQMTSAPTPPGLSEDLERAYRAELREAVRVLAAKAVVAYEESLSAARRAGVEGDFVARASAALERMRGVLAAEGEPASEPTADDHPR